MTVDEITSKGIAKYEDPNASEWFKSALWEAFRCSPTEAANDAKALAKFLSWRVKALSRIRKGAR